MIDPTEGPPGTVISTGGNCSGDVYVDATPSAVPNAPSGWDIEVTLTGPGVNETVSTTSEWEGDWSAEITVPDDATPGDTLEVAASCTYFYLTSAAVANQPPPAYEYEPAEFLVTQPPTTTTEATTTTTTEATTTTAAVAPVVAAQPAFTG